ncbi:MULTISPECIES: LemA family protein [Emticicia]|uniref:LemA family protein n=1 Tax=Emticicia TaxID=312278 RepID=UPI00209FDD18|nr:MULTISPECIES: LemA family protein [Emticicia]UTA68170.1 LemA family protein [Emticicia sp. 21SJ11W-3]
MKKSTLIIIGIILLLSVYGCSSYNGLLEKDQEVKRKWSNVQTQYQRRSDLIPNLVSTVKGAADFEKTTLTQVIEARAKATSMQINPENLTPENIQKFQAAQDQLSGALSRLLVSVEQYPQLKANENFLELQSQLEGTENRIGVARNEFNGAVQTYNTAALRFPAVIFAKIFGFSEKGFFQASDAAQAAPTVKF